MTAALDLGFSLAQDFDTVRQKGDSSYTGSLLQSLKQAEPSSDSDFLYLPLYVHAFRVASASHRESRPNMQKNISRPVEDREMLF